MKLRLNSAESPSPLQEKSVMSESRDLWLNQTVTAGQILVRFDGDFACSKIGLEFHGCEADGE
jgi:hypothetical protein